MPAQRRRNTSPSDSAVKKARRTTRKASTREKLVRKALALIERRMDQEAINSSLSDLIRLLELSEERECEEVRAGWVDPET
jgi:hypothetical protein